MMEKITVGIPCYNADATIRTAIESARNQQWDDIEILVVDDCSSDHSREIIEEIGQKDSRVRIICHERNTGVGGVRNTILAVATGEFVAFFDDDDESDPLRLKKQHDRIIDYEERTRQQLIACYASGSRRYPNGYVFEFSGIGSQPQIPSGAQVADYLLFNKRIPGVFYGAGTPASALMARRSTFEVAGSFDSNFRRVEDVDFAVRLALKGGHFIGCPEQLYSQFATHGNDKSAEANYQAEMRLFEKHRAYLETRRRYQYARCWFQFRFYLFNKSPLKAFYTLLGCWVKNPWLVSCHLIQSAPRRVLHEVRMGNFRKGR